MKLAQGATEYLVLLAVVLIVALVSVALLGFFPGMASDAQETQSKTYWASASPIAVVEWAAHSEVAVGGYTYPYLRIRNTGMYPIRITKMLGGTESISQVNTGSLENMADLYYLAPGEEKYFSSLSGGPSNPLRSIYFHTSGGSATNYFRGASQMCSFNQPYGSLVINNFGFEYIEYVEGQQITKRETGAKPLAIRCKSQS